MFLGFRVLCFLDLVLGFLGLVFGIETWAWFVSVCNLGVAVGAVVVCCLRATASGLGAFVICFSVGVWIGRSGRVD